MRFSTFAVLSVVATASAFVPASNTAFTRQQSLFALADLEAKLLAPPEAAAPKVKAEKPKPAPRVKAEKVEKPPKAPRTKPTPKAEKEAAPVPPVATPAPAPAISSKASSGKYDLGPPDKKKGPVKLKSAARINPKPEKPKAEPKFSLPTVPKLSIPKAAKQVAPPKAPVDSDPSALPLGVVLGGAPLVLAPVVALAAGRDFLSRTSARRQQIEDDIAAKKAAEAKKEIGTEVDGAGLASAVVSTVDLVVLSLDV